MAIVLHATLRRNVASVLRDGLLCRRALRKRKAVWVASEDMEKWAVKHCVANRQCRPDEIVIFRLDIPASWLKGCRYEGLWYVERDIPPSCLTSLYRYERVEESLR